MPVFVQRAFAFTPVQAFGASLIENICFVTGCFVFGAAADRIGHARMMATGALLLLLGVVPLFAWLNASRSLPVLMLVLAALGTLVATFASVAPTLLSSLFPVAQRATGLSLVYNTAFTVFGGFAPAVLTALTATAGSEFAPAWYVVAAALPALAALAAVRRRARR